MQWCRCDCMWQRVVTLSSSVVTRPMCVYQLTTDVMARTTAETGPTNSTAVSHILIVLSTHVHMVRAADAIASQTPSSLASFKSRLVLPSSYRVTQVVLEKRPLNGCSSGSGRGNSSSSSSSSSSSTSSILMRLVSTLLLNKLVVWVNFNLISSNLATMLCRLYVVAPVQMCRHRALHPARVCLQCYRRVWRLVGRTELWWVTAPSLHTDITVPRTHGRLS